MRTTSHSSEDDVTTKSIKMLASAFGKRLDNDAIAIWSRALRPHEGLPMMRVFREATEWPKMPTLGELLAKIRIVQKSAIGFEKVPELTVAERQRSDRSAILSMLWLHYAKNWPLTAFAGHILGRQFGRDPLDALRVAVAQYDKATVLRWMDDQKSLGN